jgi:hypothetical protein
MPESLERRDALAIGEALCPFVPETPDHSSNYHSVRSTSSVSTMNPAPLPSNRLTLPAAVTYDPPQRVPLSASRLVRYNWNLQWRPEKRSVGWICHDAAS